MSNVHVTESMKASPDRVWSTIGEPASIHRWHPAFADSRALDGGRRRECTLQDGVRIVEEILTVDDPGHSYTYRITEGPLPVAEFEATLSVVPADGGGSRVEWKASFRPLAPEAEVVGMIEQVYRVGLEAVRRAVDA